MYEHCPCRCENLSQLFALFPLCRFIEKAINFSELNLFFKLSEFLVVVKTRFLKIYMCTMDAHTQVNATAQSCQS